ncbi:hypothetical protein MHU86_14373 [Fragilaria crotonensis]|nr:hypothetical protein MHU86_14373 [Fragilaria crotonensis]
MQQYLVLCAGVEHEDEINPALLEFRSTRQQLEDGAFVFPACDFLKERLGRPFPERRERHLAGVPRSRPKWTDPEHVLQVAPKREVRQELFLERLARRPHDRTDDRRTSVDRAVPGAHAPPSSDATPPSKKTKLGPSASAYFQPAFVAQPSQWAFDQERSTAEFHNRRHVGRPGLYRNLPPETVPREPTRTNLLAPATSPTPRISRQPATTRHETKSGLERYAPPSTRHRPTTRGARIVARRRPRRADISPRRHATPASRFASTGRTTPPATTSRCSNGTPRPRRRPSGPAVQRPDAGIRVSPHRTSRPAPVRPPLWPRFQERISEGAEFPLREISDSDRLADVRANLARGNHKSARGHEAKLISMLKDEASRGWQLPLPREAALEIKGCEVAPLGMVAQTSIDEKGNSIEKLRLTHDQSFSPSGVAGRSVNERVDTSQLTEARFEKHSADSCTTSRSCANYGQTSLSG